LIDEEEEELEEEFNSTSDNAGGAINGEDYD
jgi:hypothetical protein